MRENTVGFTIRFSNHRGKEFMPALPGKFKIISYILALYEGSLTCLAQDLGSGGALNYQVREIKTHGKFFFNKK